MFNWIRNLCLRRREKGTTEYYRCPNPRCKYIISKEQIEYARIDFPCPKCGRSNLSRFYKTDIF